MKFIHEHEKKTLPEGVKRSHHFFIKRKPNRLNRVEKPPEPWPMPMKAKPCGEHNEGSFFSLSSLKFTSDEIRIQDLLRARRYRVGLPNRPPDLSHLSTNMIRLSLDHLSEELMRVRFLKGCRVVMM